MSDARANWPFLHPRGVYGFVSDEGRVVGIAAPDGADMLGLCLALLDEPVTITDWLEVLDSTQNPLEAANALLAETGGKRIHEIVPLQDATYLPPRAALEPGEA